MSEQMIAEHIRKEGIDIAVDLAGSLLSFITPSFPSRLPLYTHNVPGL
jgi:hypothetical protein